MVIRNIAFIAASMAALLGGGVWVSTQEPADVVLEYQSSLSVDGRILDVAVFGDSIYVLTGDSGGTRLQVFGRDTGLKTAILDAKGGFAMAPDPLTGLIYLLAPTRQRGPFHYIYALDPISEETTLVSTLDDHYAYRDYFPGFVATGSGQLVVNNRATPERPELVLVNQTTGNIDGYIDLPPSLSDPSEPRLVQGEYLYRLRRLSPNVISALGINNGNLYVINVLEGSVLNEESLGVPDFPPTVESGRLNTAPVVFDVYQTAGGYRFDLLNGFPASEGSAVVNPDGSRSRLRVTGPELALAEVSYTAIERISPTEWLAVDAVKSKRVDRVTIR